ncbi:hypothetical protein E2C01_009734 [Portunus trituberculatus]|uniref:Uncharacterized protein n=1 Tax=Portunus trituberculatus TaxID=210409 RepID=A0A5B7D6T5_PORTR|nr:hypothetical protein [Portunus trituberculatus]
MPIFFSGGPWDTPPNERSTMNAVTLSLVVPGGSKATEGSFLKVLEGQRSEVIYSRSSTLYSLITAILKGYRVCEPSSEGTARLRIEPASDPLLGSVRAKAAKSSPDATLGRYFSFCSGFPAMRIPCGGGKEAVRVYQRGMKGSCEDIPEERQGEDVTVYQSGDKEAVRNFSVGSTSISRVSICSSVITLG